MDVKVTRRRGRPRGTGKNQLARRGLRSLPIYDSKSSSFLITLHVVDNERIMGLLKSGEVISVRIRAHKTFLLMEGGEYVEV